MNQIKNKLDQRAILEKNDEGHIYYNMVISNNTNTSQPAVFKEVRTDSILENPQSYRMAIMAFTVPTASVPVFKFNEAGPFSVTLTFGAFTAYQPVVFFAPNPTYTVANIYVYNDFLKQVNVALLTAFNTLAGLTVLPVGAVPPFFIFNPANQIFSLVARSDLYNTYAGGANTFNASRISIYSNAILSNFFDGMSYIYHAEGNALGLDYEFVVQEESNPMTLAYSGATASTTIPQPSYYPAGTYTPYFVMNQQYASTINWYQATHLQFTSTLMPLQNEYIQGSNNNSIALITDFQMPLSEQIAQQRPYVQFFPQGQFRYIDLKGNIPFKIFDMSVYWTDDLQDRTLLYLPPKSVLSMKILFEKKK